MRIRRAQRIRKDIELTQRVAELVDAFQPPLDVTTGTLSVIGRKLNLAGLNLANGVDVELTVRQAMTVQNVPMVQRKMRDYIYIAPAPLERDSLSRRRLAGPPSNGDAQSAR